MLAAKNKVIVIFFRIKKIFVTYTSKPSIDKETNSNSSSTEHLKIVEQDKNSEKMDLDNNQELESEGFISSVNMIK
jgi:hypothetical protein